MHRSLVKGKDTQIDLNSVGIHDEGADEFRLLRGFSMYSSSDH